MKCDLKIAVGGIVPARHVRLRRRRQNYSPRRRFICSHAAQPPHRSVRTAAGQKREWDLMICLFRRDIEEAASMARFGFHYQCLYNRWGETARVFAGALQPAYAAGVAESKIHYFTPPVHDKDIVITNAFVKPSEASSCLNVAYPPWDRKGGTWC